MSVHDAIYLLLNKWNKTDKKQAIIAELTEQGVVFGNLKEAINKEMDIFDMICHTAPA